MVKSLFIKSEHLIEKKRPPESEPVIIPKSVPVTVTLVVPSGAEVDDEPVEDDDDDDDLVVNPTERPTIRPIAAMPTKTAPIIFKKATFILI